MRKRLIRARQIGLDDSLEPRLLFLQALYGRFTAPPAEPQPRDASDWLEDADDAIRHAQNQSLPRRKRLAPLNEVAHCINCIERAKECL